MFPRYIRTTFAAVRHLSTEASVVAAAAPLATEGSLTSTGKTKTAGNGDPLGRRIFSLANARRSAFRAISKWKDEGNQIHKHELNRIIRELRKLKRHRHALEVCEWMKIQPDIKLQPGDYAIQLDLIAKVRGLNHAEKFFEDMPGNMRDHHTCTALLHTYVQHKDTKKAEALLEKMLECGFLKYPFPYNQMLSLYISTGQLEKVPGIILQLKKNVSPDVMTYNLWLSVCASQNQVETAEKVFLEMKKAKISPDWVTYSTLTNMYIKNSLNEKALLTLKDTEKRVNRKVRVAYASLISLYTCLENKKEVHRVWKKIKSTFQKMNDAEYACFITSLLKLKEFEEAEKVYMEWESVSPIKESRVPNLILAAYINRNQIEKAEEFYARMVQKGIAPSYTTWELLTWGYLNQRQVEKAIDSFKKTVGSVKKWDPDEKMVQEVLKIVEESGSGEGAEQVLSILQSAGHVNTGTYNSVLRTYAKGGKIPVGFPERMKKDKVLLDDETWALVKLDKQDKC